MPSGALRARSASRSFLNRASDTMLGASLNAASSATVVKVSSTASAERSAPTLMSGMQLLQIGDVLERFHADAAIGVEETLALLPHFQIVIDHALDGARDFVRRKAR